MGKSPKLILPWRECAAVTPNHFAAIFGREVTWAYRKIYDGSVKTLSTLGRLLIPTSEIHRLLAGAETYDGLSRDNGRAEQAPATQQPNIETQS